MRYLRTDHEDDRGVTLVELLVYSVLLSVVLVIAGSILIRALATQRDVRAMAQASDDGQVAVRLFERAVRSAAEVSIPAAHGGNLIVVKTRVDEVGADPDSWICRAWHYDAASDELRTVFGPATGTPVTSGLTAPLDTSTWTVALSGVVPTHSGATALPVFSAESATGGKITFDVLTGKDANRLSFSAAAIPRSQGTTIGGASCL